TVKAILDSKKVGQRYEYLVAWKDLPDTENSWIPLTDIPDSQNNLIDKFHRRHLHSPCPPASLISKSKPFIDSSPAIDSTSFSNSSTIVPVSLEPHTRPAPPLASRRPQSPKPVTENLRSDYYPAPQTTTRSGRTSKPPSRLNP
ncbi:hypothetical protein F5050DRAFT_1571807, partial [Lentinula boryana]